MLRISCTILNSITKRFLVSTHSILLFFFQTNFTNANLLGSDLASSKGNIIPFNDNDLIDGSATGVRFGQHFWVIGGSLGHGYHMINSYIWNIHKKKWTMGPNYNRETKYDFSYTCGIALNSSAVLFVGVRKTVPSLPNNCIADAIDIHCRTVPKFSVMYDLERYAWIEQDSLAFPPDENEVYGYDYGDNTACTIDQMKNQSRLLDIIQPIVLSYELAIIISF